MAAERERHPPIIIRHSAAPLGGAPPPEVIARRRQVVSDMRRLRDGVVGTIPGTIADLLTDEEGDSAVNE